MKFFRLAITRCPARENPEHPSLWGAFYPRRAGPGGGSFLMTLHRSCPPPTYWSDNARLGPLRDGGDMAKANSKTRHLANVDWPLFVDRLGRRLTPRQRQVLSVIVERALDPNHPEEITVVEVASALGVTPPAVVEHLAAIQAKAKRLVELGIGNER
jgi:hypothetical protein